MNTDAFRRFRSAESDFVYVGEKLKNVVLFGNDRRDGQKCRALSPEVRGRP